VKGSGRRGVLLGASLLLLVVIVPFALELRGSGAASDATTSDGSKATFATAKVQRRDLVETSDVSGSLGYCDTHDLTFGGQGTITALAEVGTVVQRDGVLGEVDGRPVLLLIGPRPLWRTLGPGVEAGADVQQLEENLIALGHATAAQLGPDTRWTSATTTAVKRWQKAKGVDQTGTVSPGEVVFEPGPVRVAEHGSAIGAPAGGPALKVTSTEQLVDVDLEASKRTLVEVGDSVEVELPSGESASATITSVGSVAQPGQNGGAPTIPLTVQLVDSSKATGLDQAPVTVRITTTAVTDVLAVPVQALLALAEGGYAVEKQTPTGNRLVGVEIGASADGWVQVTGDIDEGDTVVTAR
jgi:peptidoglycan hydrolase-like protein with peptidoglycan-binding domain